MHLAGASVSYGHISSSVLFQIIEMFIVSMVSLNVKICYA